MSIFVPRAAKRLRLNPLPSSSTQAAYRSFSCTVAQAQQQQPKHPPHHDEGTTHFGFETVAESLKASKVGQVFSSVASSYDTMNDLMSLGIHRLWKDQFVRGLNPGVRPSPTGDPAKPQRILDIAGGTGDIALRMLDHATAINRDTTMHVTISDINPAMLAAGKKRLQQTPYPSAGRVDFLEANAEDLASVHDSSIDLYTVAFGIRNFTHKARALREAFRVLKPGGVFACLEFAPRLNSPLANAVYKRWSFGAIPLIGQIVAADRDSYQYLVESIERFPPQAEFRDMIRGAGFLIPGERPGEEAARAVGWEDISMGIAAIHKGVKPAL